MKLQEAATPHCTRAIGNRTLLNTPIARGEGHLLDFREVILRISISYYQRASVGHLFVAKPWSNQRYSNFTCFSIAKGFAAKVRLAPNLDVE